MSIPLPIETERLLIRPFDLDADSTAMAEVYCDPEVMRFIPGGAAADAAGVRSLIERYVRVHVDHGFSSWAIVERRTGQPIGDVGFAVFRATGDVELGYTLAKSRWGHGFATEAAGACLALGLANFDVPRIIAVVDEENEASLRVPERIGMKRLGSVETHGRRHAVFAAWPLRRPRGG
jgi:[ribosomal protein S5]-alanine N-acetyltransferase